MSEKVQQEALNEPFDTSVIKEVQGMDYVPVAEVITRMNNVLGTNGWSSQIVEAYRDSLDPKFVIARVSVTAKIDGEHIIADGIGGKEIAMKRNAPDEIVDLGNDFKSAYSDALKKACQRLGVGLHLSREELAMRHEVEAASEVTLEEWNAVSARIKEFSDLQKTAIKEWWATNGNSDKPAFESITAELFDAYVDEAKRIARGVEEALSVDEIAEAVGGTVQDEAPF